MARRFTSCLFPAFCLALLIAAAPAFSQSFDQIEIMQPPAASDDPVSSEDNGMRDISVTDRLNRLPEAVAAFQEWHEAKALGALPAAKTATFYDIGSEKEFHVYKDLLKDRPVWETRKFTLAVPNDKANIWIANDQQGVASEAQIEKIAEYMLTKTPEVSFRPEQGVVANNTHIFGAPPNSPDTDGQIDVLLFDIEEGLDDCCVLGYVTRADLDPTPDPGMGNAANIAYVDLPQGISGGAIGIAGTFAHEHQHLIHHAYELPGSSGELTFINEGLSEWSELLNGLDPRGIRYLADPEEVRVRLLTWRHSGTVRQVQADYQRSGLFTTYIADRIGPEATGSITRAKCPSGATFCPIGSWLVGVDGYDLVLGEKDIETKDVVADFHAANFINDASVDPKYAYKSPFRQSVKASPTILVDIESDPVPSEATVNVSSGAAEYLSWVNVTDLALEIKDFGDTGDGGDDGGGGEGPPSARIEEGAGASNRDNLSLRLLTETKAGEMKLVDLDPETQTHAVKGEYARVTLIVVNTRLSASFNAPSVKLDITGTWGGASFSATTVAYETGTNQDRLYLRGHEEGAMAHIYAVPPGSRLSSVFTAPVYNNQYSNAMVPAGLPRDFVVKVWKVRYRELTIRNPSRTLRVPYPGEEIYSMDVEESLAASSHINFASHSYSFLRVNLPQDEPSLASLPDSVFVGVTNKGDDMNYLSYTFSRSNRPAQDTLSYLHLDIDGNTGWRPMPVLRLCRKEGGGCNPDDDEDGWFSFAGQVFPLRVRFLSPLEPVSADAPLELPSGLRLSQNYPNPFNPSTSISWTQPTAARIRLSVYNLLGQKVATPVDGLRPAGEHEVRLDGSGWPSGVYVYALETGEHIATRRMVLMK